MPSHKSRFLERHSSAWTDDSQGQAGQLRKAGTPKTPTPKAPEIGSSQQTRFRPPAVFPDRLGPLKSKHGRLLSSIKPRTVKHWPRVAGERRRY